MTRLTLAALALTSLAAAAPAQAQTADAGCDDLIEQYNEYINTADTLVTDLVGKALEAGDAGGVLSSLGIDAGGVSPEQAAQKGALAAVSPPSQAAIAIYLLRAQAAMQTIAWKGCQPPG